jgi:hypothetical protein
MKFARRIELPQDVDRERRASTRYPLTLEIRYTILQIYAPVKVGTGRTTDVSNSGLSFTTDMLVRTGQRIRAYIDWPARLNENVRLQLEVWGVAIRTDGTRVAVAIEGYGFRTRGLRPPLHYGNNGFAAGWRAR